MNRKALGRGISALIADDRGGQLENSGLLEIDIDLISPNADQPRTRFEENALAELAQSIQENGVVQPIVVRKKGAKYEIVAGERRWRASQRIGLLKIPAVVKDVADNQLLELALIENIQREELNVIEEARAYRRLNEDFGLTQELISKRVGKDRSVVANHLRLLKLPHEIIVLIEDQKLSAGHARAILSIQSDAGQRDLAKLIIEKGYSVRDAEKASKNFGEKAGKAKEKAEAPSLDPNIKAAETKLRRHLGTQVRISPKKWGAGGNIEIEYFNDSDLDRIYSLLLNK